MLLTFYLMFFSWSSLVRMCLAHYFLGKTFEITPNFFTALVPFRHPLNTVKALTGKILKQLCIKYI